MSIKGKTVSGSAEQFKIWDADPQLDTYLRHRKIQKCTTGIGTTIHGAKNGSWSFFECQMTSWIAGQLAKDTIVDNKGNLKIAVTYDNDKLIGNYTSYYSDSLKKSIFKIQNDSLIDSFWCYSEKRKLVLSGKVRPNGIRADCKQLHPNGYLFQSKSLLVADIRKKWLIEVEDRGK